jgi:ribosomal protein L37AE/L43A
MAIDRECPSCHASLDLVGPPAGRPWRCPNCGATLAADVFNPDVPPTAALGLDTKPLEGESVASTSVFQKQAEAL